MQKLIAWVFMYSVDGLLADNGTEYWNTASACGIPKNYRLELISHTEFSTGVITMQYQRYHSPESSLPLVAPSLHSRFEE